MSAIALVALLAAVGAAFATADTPSAEAAKPKPLRAKGAAIVFPLVGTYEYGNNYGDARANGSHAGIDIMSPRRAAVVAAEAGTVKWWTTSARAGCMLYLHGESGTTYLYIHLNNDRTLRNDNRAGCKAGATYTVKDGAGVEAGQQIAWNGDSGDADGNPHLHFEVHPGGGDDVNPMPYLDAATRHLLPGAIGKRFTAGLRGTPLSAGGGVLELRVSAVRWWPNGRWTAIEPRSVEVAVPPDADADPGLLEALAGGERRTLSSRKAGSLTVFTAPAAATEAALRGDPSALTARRVVAR